jgi:hypothetical protein
MLLNQTHQAKVQSHTVTTLFEAVYRLIVNQICLLLVLQAAHRTSGFFMMHYSTLFSFQGTFACRIRIVADLTAFICYHVYSNVSTYFSEIKW